MQLVKFRTFFRFRLRTALILMAASAMALGYTSQSVRAFQREDQAIGQLYKIEPRFRKQVAMVSGMPITVFC